MHSRSTQTHKVRILIAAAAMVIALIGWSAFQFVAQAQNSLQAFAPEDAAAITNGKIVFSAFRNSALEIFTINPDGTGTTQLTTSIAQATNDDFPAYNRDGTQIVFTRNGKLWLMNSDGTNQRMIGPGVDGRRPAWSPDGTQLTYSATVNGALDIFVMNLDGSNRINLTNSPQIEDDPTWGAQDKIAFERTVSSNSDVSNLYMVSPTAGAPAQQLTFSTGALNYDPDWSPDGTQIVFLKLVFSTNITIIDVDVPGGNVIGDPYSLSGDGFQPDQPVFSPDGMKIAYSSSRDDGRKTVIVNKDGSGTRVLLATGAFDVDWARGPESTMPSPTPTPGGGTADLALTLTDAPDPAIEHQNVVYTATVTNNGPGNSQGNLRVTLTLENFVGLRGVFVTASSGCTNTGDGVIICQSDQNLTSGSSIAFTVTVRYRPSRGTGTPDATAAITRNGQTDPNSGNNSASVETTIQAAPTPANDNFNNAQNISTPSSCATGSNIGATTESPFRGINRVEEPYHGGRIQGRSVWYKWTAPNYDGNVSFDTGGSGFNTILAVYAIRTDFPDALTEIASNNDSFNRGTSYVYFRAERLRTYYVAVTGFDREAGSINLCWNVSQQVIPAPVPQQIDRITPPFISHNPTRGELILLVEGSGFTTNSRAQVNSQDCFRPNAAAQCETNTSIQTTFISSTSLRVVIPAMFVRSAGVLVINVVTGSAMSNAAGLQINPLTVVTVPPLATASGSATGPSGASVSSTVTNNTTTPINATNTVYDAGLLPNPPPPGQLIGPAFGVHLIGQDGAGIISNDGASVQAQIATGIISNDGASAIGQGAASLVVLANSAGQIISNDGASIISNDGASIISGGGGNLLPRGALTDISSFTGPLEANSPAGGNTGWYVVRSAGGVSPTVSVNPVNADGDATVSASMAFNATSSPSISQLARTVFLIVNIPTVTVDGRVITPSGNALRNVRVTMIGSDGSRRSAVTSSFGTFSFTNVPNFDTYTFTIASKRYRFAPRTLPVSNNLTLADFVGLE